MPRGKANAGNLAKNTAADRVTPVNVSGTKA